MPKYSFETIEQMLLKCVPGAASPNLAFATLRELYAAPQIDGRSLEDFWDEADEFYCPNFEP